MGPGSSFRNRTKGENHESECVTNKTTERNAKHEGTDFFSGETGSAGLLLVMACTGPLLAQTPQQQAWNILRAGVNEKNTGKRTQAVRALRLLPGDPEAVEMAEKALQDQKPAVRAAAATALG